MALRLPDSLYSLSGEISQSALLDDSEHLYHYSSQCLLMRLSQNSLDPSRDPVRNLSNSIAYNSVASLRVSLVQLAN